mgnify:CR=1 FL=1
MDFWFNDNFGLNIGLQYGWYNYNYTYDYATSEAAIEQRWRFNNLILPIGLKIAIPFWKNRAFVGGGVIVFKQLSGELSGICWGQDIEVQNIANEYLKTGVLPRFLVGAEFHPGNIGYQFLIDYYYGLNGVDERYDGSSTSTHHLIFNVGILYYLGKGKS